MDSRQRLAELIAAAGISQAEVARRVGENPQWVNNRLRGEADIKADDIPRLAMALRVSPASFFQQSSLAEVVLAVFLRVLAEVPAEYRQQIWDLAARIEGPRSAQRPARPPEPTGSTDGALAEKTTAHLTQLWGDLPDDEKSFIKEIIEARHRHLDR